MELLESRLERERQEPASPPKRFLLFAGERYYPSGGWNDFVLDFDTAEDAAFAGRSLAERRREQENLGHFSWWHVVDSQTLRVVYARPQW